MSKTYYGLRETSYAGTLSAEGESVRVAVRLRFVDDTYAALDVDPGDRGQDFTLVFSWHWEPDPGEAWIGVVKLEQGGRTVSASSTGKIVGDQLELTVTPSEKVSVLGTLADELRIEATESS